MSRVQENGPGHPKKGNHSWTILLAGGEGRRLSHFVRAIHPDNRPKQFATIIGTRSMLQHTYDRALRHSPPERILVVTTEGQQGWALAQLPRAPREASPTVSGGIRRGPVAASYASSHPELPRLRP